MAYNLILYEHSVSGGYLSEVVGAHARQNE